MMNKKGDGVLRNIFIGILLFCMVFLALFSFYSDIVTDYKDYNITTPPEMDKVHSKINESFYKGHGDSLTMSQSLREQSGTKETGEGATILNSFFGSISFIKNTFSLVDALIPAVATALKIPDIWWKGLIAIISITLFILIIGGILSAPKW